MGADPAPCQRPPSGPGGHRASRSWNRRGCKEEALGRPGRGEAGGPAGLRERSEAPPTDVRMACPQDRLSCGEPALMGLPRSTHGSGTGKGADLCLSRSHARAKEDPLPRGQQPQGSRAPGAPTPDIRGWSSCLRHHGGRGLLAEFPLPPAGQEGSPDVSQLPAPGPSLPSLPDAQRGAGPDPRSHGTGEGLGSPASIHGRG